MNRSSPSSLPRRLQTFLTYTLLGLITSIAIAWFLATRPLTTGALVWEGDVAATPGSWLDDYGLIGFGRIRRQWRTAEIVIANHLDASGERNWEARIATAHINAGGTHPAFAWQWSPTRWGLYGTRPAGCDDARGFPALCLWMEVAGSWVDDPQSDGAKPACVIKGGIPLPSLPTVAGTRYDPHAAFVRALPYRPIWAGLAINTAFYGLLCFAAIRGTRALRHLRRFNRGRCPRCAYDRANQYTTPCPECGWKSNFSKDPKISP